MSRLVSLLLIFSLLLVQSLPHSHAGSGVDQPDDHALRPHIHLSLHGHSHGEHQGHGHSHHDHLDDHAPAGATCLYGVHDHDDDAIYLAGSTFSRHRLSAIGVPTYLTNLTGSAPERFCLEQISGSEVITPPIRQRPLPIYLLVASLRL